MADPIDNMPHGPIDGFGSSYLREVLAAEARCEAHTDAWVKQAQGKRFPHAIDVLGRTLELVEKAACCYWGCKNPSHDLERLAARIYSLAAGAIRLVRTGRYDEALMLIRSIGEFTNLLMLFALEPASRQKWATSDEQARRREFAPVRVRKLIESKGVDPAMDVDEYGHLSEYVVHPNPRVAPGVYNAARLPVLGGHLQPEGAVIAMASLAKAVGRCAVVLPALMRLPAEQAASLLSLGAELEGSLGGHTAATMRERLRNLAQEAPDHERG
jgi:hypothetical protein